MMTNYTTNKICDAIGTLRDPLKTMVFHSSPLYLLHQALNNTETIMDRLSLHIYRNLWDLIQREVSL